MIENRTVQNKKHVYFMPGMAANPAIFDKLELPTAIFEKHFLDWSVPDKDMSLEDYALKMSHQIKHEDVVLIGVSFGGILVQEMAKHIKVEKVIIISSVKSNSELPKRMLFAKYTKVHKLLPTGLVNNMEAFGQICLWRNHPQTSGPLRAVLVRSG